MVSKGYRKRGCGVVLVKHVKNPILLAREILIRGEVDGSGGKTGGKGSSTSSTGVNSEAAQKTREPHWEAVMSTLTLWREETAPIEFEGTILVRHKVWSVLMSEEQMAAFADAASSIETIDDFKRIASRVKWRKKFINKYAEQLTRLIVERLRDPHAMDVDSQPIQPYPLQYTPPDDSDPSGGSGGAQGHCMLGGPTVEKLAEQWGLEMVPEKYFFTKRRWDEHRRGLGKNDIQARVRSEFDFEKKLDARYEHDFSQLTEAQKQELYQKATSRHSDEWDANRYLPQGTVGCCVLDQYGTLCVATSTGGLTNKLSGRIGDTPTLGAGFWAEEWQESQPILYSQPQPQSPLAAVIPEGISQAISECLPGLNGYVQVSPTEHVDKKARSTSTRALAMSGTGNGDSFLRTAACRTAAAITRFAPQRSLASAMTEIAGPGGELQRSAGDRWHKTGEGEGGIIGIEMINGIGKVVYDFNCGGMFRTWIDDEDKQRVMVFKDEY